jgi:hypothetical protein
MELQRSFSYIQALNLRDEEKISSFSHHLRMEIYFFLWGKRRQAMKTNNFLRGTNSFSCALSSHTHTVTNWLKGGTNISIMYARYKNTECRNWKTRVNIPFEASFFSPSLKCNLMGFNKSRLNGRPKEGRYG